MVRKITLLLVVLLTGCAQLNNRHPESLYQQLGEMAGIDAIVVQMIKNFAADERVADRFRNVNISHFRSGFDTYICSISGGPCTYTGESMAVVHAGHQYTNTEFNAVVDNLISAMDEKSIPVPVQNQLLALLAPNYKNIVYQ